MIVPQVPAGTYQFYCLPHRAYDMRGELTIEYAKRSDLQCYSWKPPRGLAVGAVALWNHKS